MTKGDRVRLNSELVSWTSEADRAAIYVVRKIGDECVSLHREPVNWRAMPELWARDLFDRTFEPVPPLTRFERV